MNPSIKALIHSIITQDGTIDSETAYLQLLDIGEPAITFLIEALQIDDHEQHHILTSILCDILVEVGDNDALVALSQLVNSPNNEIFTPAAHAIARMKLPIINQVLIDLLDHPAPQVRRIVAWQLGRNRATEAINILIQHLDEHDIETLRGIIWTLGHIGDHLTARRIDRFILHESEDIAFIAKEALIRIDQKAMNPSA